MQIVMSWLAILRRVGQKAGPYLMLEMLLPGGNPMEIHNAIHGYCQSHEGLRSGRPSG
jgi:hypothetical protein